MGLELFVDDTRIEEPDASVGTVEDALRHVQTAFCGPGRLVLRLRCDEREVSGEEMEATLKKQASDFTRLEVFTGTKAALVTEAMEQAAGCLEETETGCRRCAELLTEGKTSQGIDVLGECLRVWQQIHESVVKSIEMLEIDLEQTMIRDEPLSTVVGKPKDVLVQIRDSLKAQDHVMLADILQYELTEMTTQWFAIINRLRAEAEERADGATMPTS